VLVRKGRRAGGDFHNVPACTSADQTSCVIAYSAFNETPPANSRFGRAPATDTSGAGFPAGPDYEVLCTNPASLAANGQTPVTTYVRSEPFPGAIGAGLILMYGGPPPTAPTPWLQPADRYTGRCASEDGANFLMIEPIGSARTLNPSPDATWGLHLADVNIALGELVNTVASQGKAWLEGGPACLARRGRIEPPRVGPLRLGRTRSFLLRRAVVTPVQKTRRSWRWCTAGSSGALTAVFPGGSAGAKARLLVTTAPGYRIAGVGVKRRLRGWLRRFPDARRIAPGIYQGGPKTSLFFGVRRGRSRVRFAGAATRRLLHNPRLLARHLDRAGL
jgi:Protein of unknown function (DUF3089)